MTCASFIDELASAVPQVEELRAEHVAEYEELLAHVLMGDVSRFTLELYNQSRADGPDARTARATLEILFNVIERAAESGSGDVQDVVGASFLENIEEELLTYEELRSFLGPALQRRFQPLWDRYRQ
jgi:hypothetical protein